MVMSFGLTNTPITFCMLMDQVFHEDLDKFVVVYLDDIVIYSSTMGRHQHHAIGLRKVERTPTRHEQRKMLVCATMNQLSRTRH